MNVGKSRVTENNRQDNEYRIRAIEDNLLHSKVIHPNGDYELINALFRLRHPKE